MDKESNISPKVSSFAILAILFFIGCALFLVAKSLFSAKAPERKPETTPTNTGKEENGKLTEFLEVSEPIPRHSVPPEPEINFPTILTDEIPLPKYPAQCSPTTKRKRIRRNQMESIFRHGELTLTEAVSALKSLGFGKSAAYEALSSNGQFSAWLQFAADGMISWKY